MFADIDGLAGLKLISGTNTAGIPFRVGRENKVNSLFFIFIFFYFHSKVIWLRIQEICLTYLRADIVYFLFFFFLPPLVIW